MAFERFENRQLSVVVSGSAEVAEHAMRLSYRGGVESGFLAPDPSEMRFSPSYLNPGTQFAVAYSGEEPIASMAIVEDGPFGLPSDRAFAEELDQVRSAGGSLFEVGAVVIVSGWRRQMVQLITHLVGTAMRLNIDGGPHRRFVSTVEPNRVRVFSETFSREFVAGPRPYLGAPGSLLVTLPAASWPDFLLDPDGFATRKLVAERVFEPEPDWLWCNLDCDDWKEELAPEILRQHQVEAQLRARLALLTDITRRSSQKLDTRAKV